MDLTGLPAEALHNRVRALAGWPGTIAELLLLDLSTGGGRVGHGNWRRWVGPERGRGAPGEMGTSEPPWRVVRARVKVGRALDHHRTTLRNITPCAASGLYLQRGSAGCMHQEPLIFSASTGTHLSSFCIPGAIFPMLLSF